MTEEDDGPWDRSVIYVLHLAWRSLPGSWAPCSAACLQQQLTLRPHTLPALPTDPTDLFINATLALAISGSKGGSF